MTISSATALSVVILALTGAVGCGWLGGGEDTEPAGAQTSVTSSVTGEPAGHPFKSIVRKAPGSWNTAPFAPGGAIPWRHGIFFTDNWTGATKGWSIAAVPQQRPDPAPTPNSNGLVNEPQVWQYFLAGGGRWVWAVAWEGADGRSFLVNTETADAWEWDYNQLGLEAASREYLLFEQAAGPDPHQHSTGKYVVADAALNMESTFELPPSWFAPASYVTDEGKAAIWVTKRDEAARKLEYKLFMIDLPTGDSREVYATDIELVPVGQNLEQAASLQSTSTDDGVVVRLIERDLSLTTFRLERLPVPAHEIELDWDGNNVRDEFDPGGLRSPDGQYIVFEAFTRFEGGGGGEGGGDRWPVVTLARSDGTELFRVLSASMSYSDGIPEQRWLADSSGFVVMIDNSSETPGWPGDNIGYAIVHLDGSIEPLPELPAMPEPARWFESVYNRGPVPHPTNADWIAFGHFELLELERGVWHGAPYVGDDQGPQHIGPWVGGVEDRVFALPHGGHGGWGPPVLLQPLTQRAPFAEPRMVVAPGDCLNLREAPGLKAPIISCLAPGTELTLAELSPGIEPGTPAAWEAWPVRPSETGTWLKVTQGGWVNAAFVRWAD